jgi:Sulfotransferase family
MVRCFVVGCPRSGTTLLSVMLDRHSQLAMTPETSFYVEIAPRLREPQHPPLYEILAGWSRLPELGLEPGAVASRCDGCEGPGVVFAAILELYAQRRGKPYCGEKTPGHWGKLDALMADFPTAKILFVIRDGRDVALSLMELPWWSDDVAAAAAQWRGAGEVAHAAIARDPARVAAVRYEDLVRGPAAVLPRLMDFIGLSFEPRQLDVGVASPVVLTRSLPWKGRALHPPDATRIGRWRTALREQDASYLNDALATELAFFGYATEPVGQRESGTAAETGCAAHDTIARCRAHVLARIDAASAGETPFHHLFIEQIFPPEFYAALRSHMLDCKAAAAVEDRFQDSAAFVNRRHNLVTSADETAVCLRGVFSDPEVKRALLAKFYATPSRELAESLIIHQEFEYVFTKAGRFQTIHLDIPPKYLSFVFYLPEASMTPEDAADNATILYDKTLRAEHRARFEANSVCVFAPHFSSYHGFASTRDRDVLVMFYVEPGELTRYATMREAGLDEMAPFTGLLDGIERKLRRHPLIEYGHDASRLLRERATCLVNAPNGRVIHPDAPTP